MTNFNSYCISYCISYYNTTHLQGPQLSTTTHPLLLLVIDNLKRQEKSDNLVNNMCCLSCGFFFVLNAGPQHWKSCDSICHRKRKTTLNLILHTRVGTGFLHAIFASIFPCSFVRALRLNTSRYAQWAKQLPTCNNDRPSVTCRRLGMASTSWLRRISKVSNSTLDCSSCSCTSVTCLDKPWNLDCNNTWRGALVLSAQHPQHSLWA